jgi:hypothetical protein
MDHQVLEKFERVPHKGYPLALTSLFLQTFGILAAA